VYKVIKERSTEVQDDRCLMILVTRIPLQYECKLKHQWGKGKCTEGLRRTERGGIVRLKAGIYKLRGIITGFERITLPPPLPTLFGEAE